MNDIFIHWGLLTRQWQILIQKSGLAAGYIVYLHTFQKIGPSDQYLPWVLCKVCCLAVWGISDDMIHVTYIQFVTYIHQCAMIKSGSCHCGNLEEFSPPHLWLVGHHCPSQNFCNNSLHLSGFCVVIVFDYLFGENFMFIVSA